ncbi:YL1 nuclear [Sodiomyces alkalinus F11]|uniref:YL1 nuclear n=1 Tax=Sodiomyces alkalinus (strain CBS 110278 / VKM F-3762 / F11) TaxID=1314773 RepID=A0A3N2PY45_SODAK|nr:YL1 nuclear [Sodiomyces alkalinus F11]ROT39402.1 YL1 nuclear [Sodiomyces alkalinus F11]
MAAPTEAQLAHQKLLDELDLHSVHKTFRASSWRPNHRRNKNIKTILMDASRKEASSSVATPQDVSGSVTPMPTLAAPDSKDDGLSTSGSSTPANGADALPNNQNPNLSQASRSLSKLVLEKTLRQGAAASATGASTAPSVTYTNIESAPSLAHTRHYCDATGLPAPYLDPKTRLRYHDREVFSFIRSLPQGVAEQYLEARGAHVVLK